MYSGQRNFFKKCWKIYGKRRRQKMRCNDIVDMIIDHDGDEELSFFRRFLVDLHLFFCPRCAETIRRWHLGRGLLAASCQDPELKTPGLETPDLSGVIMAGILAETEEVPDPADVEALSFRRWVVTGFVIVVSLISVYFGLDFIELSSISSLKLPMGVTIGIFISAYSALFIGSHLKELSERFRLR
jgi:hypothetical protein